MFRLLRQTIITVGTARITKLATRAILHVFRYLCRMNGDKWLPEIAQAYPVLIETWHHPQLARWFAYRRIISIGQVYNRIFLADTKDVVFQARFLESSERRRVGDHLCRRRGLRQLLLERYMVFGGVWKVCSCGRFRATASLYRYGACDAPRTLKKLYMLREFTVYIARSPFGRIEQAIFNYMLNLNLFETKFEMDPNIEGAVATLGSEAAHASVSIIDGRICRRDGSVIPVVHMYDRWPDTKVLFERYT